MAGPNTFFMFSTGHFSTGRHETAMSTFMTRDSSLKSQWQSGRERKQKISLSLLFYQSNKGSKIQIIEFVSRPRGQQMKLSSRYCLLRRGRWSSACSTLMGSRRGSRLIRRRLTRSVNWFFVFFPFLTAIDFSNCILVMCKRCFKIFNSVLWKPCQKFQIKNACLCVVALDQVW